ncbi:MAG TPA: hypothetical protein VL860_02875 [Planctomycetota bacterium]|nr:hypothetical protein [Planctomycetota bacterium]
MSENHNFQTVRERTDGDFLNRLEMRRRFSFLDDVFAQWREDIEGHLGIGLFTLPIFLCFLLLSLQLFRPAVQETSTLFQWLTHASFELLLVLLFLPIGPILVGVSRYFLIHQRMRRRAAERAPSAIQTFTQPHLVDASKWAARPPFGLVVSGFQPPGPALTALVLIFLIGVLPASLLMGLAVWLNINLHFIFAMPVYLCALLIGFGLTTMHLYTFHFIAESGLPASEALKASREAVKADPLLAIGTVLMMAMLCSLGLLLCAVGLLPAVPAAWLVLTRAYLSLPDRPPDLALNEFDPIHPTGSPSGSPGPTASSTTSASGTPDTLTTPSSFTADASKPAGTSDSPSNGNAPGAGGMDSKP